MNGPPKMKVSFHVDVIQHDDDNEWGQPFWKRASECNENDIFGAFVL